MRDEDWNELKTAVMAKFADGTWKSKPKQYYTEGWQNNYQANAPVAQNVQQRFDAVAPDNSKDIADALKMMSTMMANLVASNAATAAVAAAPVNVPAPVAHVPAPVAAHAPAPAAHVPAPVAPVPVPAVHLPVAAAPVPAGDGDVPMVIGPVATVAPINLATPRDSRRTREDPGSGRGEAHRARTAR